jgi:hypothetical protein
LQVFSSRQPRKNDNNKKSEDIRDSYGLIELRDSQRDRDQRCDQQQGTSRVYTPAQFENSLGKLQVYYVHGVSFEFEVPFWENVRNDFVVVVCLYACMFVCLFVVFIVISKCKDSAFFLNNRLIMTVDTKKIRVLVLLNLH